MTLKTKNEPKPDPAASADQRGGGKPHKLIKPYRRENEAIVIENKDRLIVLVIFGLLNTLMSRTEVAVVLTDIKFLERIWSARALSRFINDPIHAGYKIIVDGGLRRLQRMDDFPDPPIPLEIWRSCTDPEVQRFTKYVDNLERLDALARLQKMKMSEEKK